MMDEICEGTNEVACDSLARQVIASDSCADAGNYHSKDMITVDDGADKPGTILCGYHELRRHMAEARVERERLARRETDSFRVEPSRIKDSGRTAAGSGGPGGWW